MSGRHPVLMGAWGAGDKPRVYDDEWSIKNAHNWLIRDLHVDYLSIKASRASPRTINLHSRTCGRAGT